jgi:ATP-dependent DNA helicase RecG
MEEFRSGRAKILVSTTVVEVGVDVPNASIMVIENAERYGLAQLHQLRGRIGRGPHASVCVVFGERSERIDAFVSTSDGFRIAEEDLRLRGSGDVGGVRQSGLRAFKAARLPQDVDILEEARDDARALAEDEAERILRGGALMPLLHIG